MVMRGIILQTCVAFVCVIIVNHAGSNFVLVIIMSVTGQSGQTNYQSKVTCGTCPLIFWLESFLCIFYVELLTGTCGESIVGRICTNLPRCQMLQILNPVPYSKIASLSAGIMGMRCLLQGRYEAYLC